MNHTQLINHLISKHNLKSYLEIGINNPANNFDKINCSFKIGVDPAVSTHDTRIWSIESDEFFQTHVGNYDLIFIDGLHHSDQVKKDFENSLRCLNDGGFIVIHDCLPEDEITTCVPRGNQKMWHGDVYKWAMTVKSYSDINFVTFDMDNGCMVVWKEAGVSHKFDLPVFKVNWQQYVNHSHSFMNIVSPNEIDKALPA